MADPITLPQPRRISLSGQALFLIPGILLLAAVGYGGKFIEQFIARYAKAHHHLVCPTLNTCCGRS